MKLLNIAALTLFALAAACASGTTTVLEPSARSFKTATITIEHAEDTVPVDAEFGAYYREQLEKELFKDGGFTRGEDLTLRYRFIQLDRAAEEAANYAVANFRQ